MYSELVIPLLSHIHRKKHFNFSKRVLKNLGRGRGEYLYIHFGENWFQGMMLHKTAKKFDGLKPEAVREYHKSRI